MSARAVPAPHPPTLRAGPSLSPCPRGEGWGEGPAPADQPAEIRLRGAAAVGEFGLRAGDEFEEAGVAVLVLLAGAQDRVADLAGIVDPLAPAAEILADSGVIAAEVAGPVLFVRGAHRVGLDRHRRVVEDDRRDRYAAAHR